MRRFGPSAGLFVLLFVGIVRSGESTERGLELTQVARAFPRHKGPTVLYANFDGWTKHDKEGHTIEPFQSTTGNRDRDIQDILFRTSQRFAPFDVEVRRITGNGKYDRGTNGNTTVFVGGDTAHIDKDGKKFSYGSTPARYLDYPGSGRGDSHRPNSDPFDLAFVDPMVQGKDGKGWASDESNNEISQTIAHEAGHTFGLAHTHSKPIPDLMSYDTSNVYFADKALPITNDNNTGAKLEHDDNMIPKWRHEPVVRQNSFTYLSTVLGPRKGGQHAKVADRRSVDPGFKDGKLATMQTGDLVASELKRFGDYDVYRLQVRDQTRLRVRVQTDSESDLTPLVLVYDDKGDRLLSYRNGRAAKDRQARLVVRLEAGKAYKLVIGAADGATKGGYRLGIDAMAEK